MKSQKEFSLKLLTEGLTQWTLISTDKVPLRYSMSFMIQDIGLEVVYMGYSHSIITVDC